MELFLLCWILKIFPLKEEFNTDKSHPNYTIGLGGQSLNQPDTQAAKDALWNGEVFTADQRMIVEVAWNVWFHQSGGPVGDVQTRLMTTASANGGSISPAIVNSDTITSFGSGSCAGTRDDFNAQTTVVTVQLEDGEKLWLESQEITIIILSLKVVFL